MRTLPGDLSAFYRAGGAMGLTPAQVRAMTVAELACVVAGFGQFHSGRDADEGRELRDSFRRALEAEAAAGRI